ncbi:hypothetical protein GCM10007907_05790 [Chitinimonas prasina]|uniref:Uncharacterized protein n=1 Tax=Chitinimonas prasina TaxID=1434937 RepID=A0ABQ5YFT4_9NEIS|nr:hypothetical protein [Chitinimonas prasina]GLR11789.1 hypothetical protein GCM10007907_05790 [Chitinimonas prasina]
MKKSILLASLLATFFAINASAAVTSPCTGTATGGKTTIAGGALGTDFIIRDFSLACSKNVFLSYNWNATSAWVAAGSGKGATIFGGTTEGGGGANCLNKTAGLKPDASNVSAALTNAETATFCK